MVLKNPCYTMLGFPPSEARGKLGNVRSTLNALDFLQCHYQKNHLSPFHSNSGAEEGALHHLILPAVTGQKY